MTLPRADAAIVTETLPPAALLGMAAALGIPSQQGSVLGLLGRFNAPTPTGPPPEPWDQVLATMARSTRRVDGALSGSDGALVLAFHGDHDDNWVGLWPDGDRLRVTGPLTSGSLGRYVAVLFSGLRTPSSAQPIRLSDAGMGAFAAVVDAWRVGALQAWARRGRAGAVSARAIGDALQAGVATDDSRWLVTLLNDISPVPRDTAVVVEQGVAELLAAGLIRAVPGGCELSDPVREIADDTWFPQPALALTIGAELPGRRLIAARGADTVWTFRQPSAGWVVEGVDDVGLSEMLARLVTGAEPASGAAT